MLVLNKQQQYIVDLIENWDVGTGKTPEIVIPKDPQFFTVSCINEERFIKRVFRKNNGTEVIGNYDTRKCTWQVEALNDAGLFNGFIDEKVLSYFINKRMFQGDDNAKKKK